MILGAILVLGTVIRTVTDPNGSQKQEQQNKTVRLHRLFMLTFLLPLFPNSTRGFISLLLSRRRESLYGKSLLY